MFAFIWDKSTKNRLIPYAVSRIMIGLFFFISGANKIFNPDFQLSMLKTITSIGFPYPQFVAHFTAANEAVFGLLLTIGLFTRLSSVVLSIILTVALITTNIPELPSGLNPVTWYSYFLYLPEVLYVLFMLNALATGGGPMSIDSRLVQKRGIR